VATKVEGSSVLVVDDSIEHLRRMSAILKRGGLVPRPIANGNLAIEAALADPPDLVLLDCLVSEMSGLDICRKLKQQDGLRDIPVIFVSALQGLDDKVQAFDAGAVDYVCKPFQEQEVLARIKTHLRLRRLHMDLILRVAPHADHSRHTVLVVDDDVQLLRVLGETLSRDEFDVLTARDGMEAMSLLERTLPCMVITDVNMDSRCVATLHATRGRRTSPSRWSVPGWTKLTSTRGLPRARSITSRSHSIWTRSACVCECSSACARP